VAAGADLLLLFTDGVSDARDRAGQALGERAVLDAVAAARGASSLDEVVRRTFAMLDATATAPRCATTSPCSCCGAEVADDVDEARLPRPRKRFGQHFLRDRQVLGRIADALGLTGAETVVEIGPGRGALTDLLAPRAGRLVAVEIDRDLAAHLRARYAASPHVSVVEADVLEVELAALAGPDFVLAGNVPYYITTPIIFHALRPPRPARAVYLVQREVAERLTAAPGGKEYGALSVNVQAVARARAPAARAAGRLPAAAQGRLGRRAGDPARRPGGRADEERRFRTFVQAAFGMRRKQMVRVVRTVSGLDPEAAAAVLAEAGVAPGARPETLAPEAFARVVRALRSRGALAADPAGEPPADPRRPASGRERGRRRRRATGARRTRLGSGPHDRGAVARLARDARTTAERVP
jgi:16S rRNA (adenine1518-N6/adenine1519-N6)-dimethyltransferase